MSGFSKLFIVVCSGLLAACASVPLESIRSYSDAFQQARSAGDLLLDEISPIVSGVLIKSGKTKKCGKSKLGYPLCFDPAQVAADGSVRPIEHASITARRDALAAVSLYNQMLLDLAEGKSVDAIQAKIDEFSNLAGAISKLGIVGGGLPALIGPTTLFVKNLAGRFEQARANNAVRQAILESKSDIQELLNALADDTPNIYNVFRRGREKGLVDINHDRNVARLAKDPQLQASASKRYNSALKSISLFHESLTAYVQLLNSTKNALDALANTARQPQATTANLTQIITEAAEIRVRSQNFWRKIREVRTSAAAANQ